LRTYRTVLLLLAAFFLACFAPAPVGDPVVGALETDDLLVSGTATFLGDAQFGSDFSDTLTIGAAWDNDLMFVGDGFPRTISFRPPPAGNNGGTLTVKSGPGANATSSTAAGIGGDFILGGALGGAGDATHPPKPGAKTLVRGGNAGALGGFGGEAFGGDVVIDAGIGVGREQHGLFTGIDGAIKIGTQIGRIILVGRGGTGESRDDGTIFDVNGIMFQAHGALMLQPEGNDPRSPSFIRNSNGPFEITARGTDGSGNYNGGFFPLKLYSSSLELPLHTTAEAAPSAGFGRIQARTVGGVPKLFVLFPGGVEKEIAFVN
jgi:hypothetical protein